MGMFQVRAHVANPADPARSFDEDFWVDTGALYTFAPADRLAAIGLTPIGSRELILADGRQERCPLGEARIGIGGFAEALTCQIVFAPGGSLYLLGATALQAFSVAADPVAKRLKPVPALIGGFRATR